MLRFERNSSLLSSSVLLILTEEQKKNMAGVRKLPNVNFGLFFNVLRIFLSILVSPPSSDFSLKISFWTELHTCFLLRLTFHTRYLHWSWDDTPSAYIFVYLQLFLAVCEEEEEEKEMRRRKIVCTSSVYTHAGRRKEQQQWFFALDFSLCFSSGFEKKRRESIFETDDMRVRHKK